MSHKLILDDPKLNFSAAHFLIEHDKCSRIHGHNYYVQIEILGNLDKNSMIIDFLEVKKIIQESIQHLDHKLILPMKNPAIHVNENGNNLDIKIEKTEKFYSIPKEDIAQIPIDATTAECIAQYIYSILKEKLSVNKFQIMLNENTGSWAAYGDF
ncbi:MAG: 6-carboxytetrahydropterin synthase [Candidatus Helarchaeota archaeon]|nr:6-carboxytetrahydropterin synthase [Candidatus Helarchaeota archaeon]